MEIIVRMRSPLVIVGFLFASIVASAEGLGSSNRSGKVPGGGLVELMVKPMEIGPGWTNRIRLLIDPLVDPNPYYPSKDDLPGMPRKRIDPVDPTAQFKTALEQIDAEAAVYLEYSGPSTALFVKILRFSTAAKAQAHWSLRQKSGESEVLSINGLEILKTQPGKLLRPDLRARADTLECKEGKYIVRVAPASLRLGHPGMDLLIKQVEKIRR